MQAKTMTSPLTQVLLHAQLLSLEQLAEACQSAQKAAQPLLPFILQHYAIAANTISQACARYFNLPHRELQDFDSSSLPLDLINETMIQHHAVLPLLQDQQQLLVAVCDPNDFPLLDDIQYQTGLHTQAIMVPYDQLAQLINRLLSKKNYQAIALDGANAYLQTPAVQFVEQIITDAIHQQASDIHFEPLDDRLRVRMRIDGLLHEITHVPTHLISSITCRLKVMAQCDISERRLPHDGRFHFINANGQSRDCRLSSCPTLFGEKIVLRLLDANKKLLTLDELGLEKADQTVLLDALSQPQGLILVTGPTGSGKTISLYTALAHLNQKTHNISTVEEPVEIQLPGINQVNINEKAGLTFATVLRAFLRQDPDIIMVGEIRDKETADIAVRAAQTGHLVLSTLHTNSAPETLTRLLNMGIAPFNVASSIKLIMAQRLLRKLCLHCQLPNAVANANGCHHCVGGYQGRVGIFELMPISKSLSTLILQHGANADIAQQAANEGMRSLWQSAQQKVQQCITSLTEIYRVVAHE